MRKIILFVGIVFFFQVGAMAQGVCPAGQVCIDQATANKLFDMGNQLIAAKDVIAKMSAERGTSGVALQKALVIIDQWKEVDSVNTLMQMKYQTVITLYEKTLAMAMEVIDRQAKQLNRGKSAWDKFVGIVGKVATILIGVGIGRGIGP